MWPRRRTGLMRLVPAATLARCPIAREQVAIRLDDLRRHRGRTPVAHSHPSPIADRLSQQHVVGGSPDPSLPPTPHPAHAEDTDGHLDLVATSGWSPVDDLVPPHDPGRASGQAPVASEVDGLGVLGGDVLDPVEVDGVVDVPVLIDLVGADTPAPVLTALFGGSQ